MKLTVLATFFIFNSLTSISQFNKIKIIEDIKRNINYTYVSQEIGYRMCDSLTYFSKTGKYDSITTIDNFTYELTKDLRRISKDNHLLFTASHQQKSKETIKWRRAKNTKFEQTDYIKAYQKLLKLLDKDNFEYGEVKILPGNIGYLEIFEFNSVTLEEKVVKKHINLEKVMNFLKDTKSIIIDLRNNSGGTVDQAIKFCSYFSDESNAYFITHQHNFRYDTAGILKSGSIIQKLHTRLDIPSNYAQGKKIFLLVSNFTLSAAELVTYGIRKLNSANLIIGSRTIGAGNTYRESIDNHIYSANIPSGKLYDEKNNNFNIEGIGVTPDIEICPDSAFELAFKLSGPDYSKDSTIKYLLRSKSYYLDQYIINHISEYVGDYNKVKISFLNNKLYLIYDLNRILLEQVDGNIFLAPGFKSIFFIRDFQKVVKIKLTHEDGYIEEYNKQN